jgi:RNA polymerase sigma-70 factor, ECF subfamily
MFGGMSEDPNAAIDAIYRAEWGRILATIIRFVGDFDAAEEATQQAFEEAFVQWRERGLPEHPRAWLVQTARYMAIDRIRRKRRFAEKLESIALEEEGTAVAPSLPTEIPDDRLRLIFTCCHPALALEAQLALTLRTLCGLETDEIARAFLVPPATMAQRLVRAKKKIAEARIPYIVPETSEMPERLHAVLTVLYLVFTEGYAATRGESLVRTDLSAEAIRLARVLCALMGGANAPPEATGLLALLLLQDSRRRARVDANGDVVVLDEQDRTLWDKDEIAEALPLVERATAVDPGPFAVQAAIASVHARAARKEDTDWNEIVRLYDLLERIHPSAVVSLNRAVAVAMADGPRAGLAIIDTLANDLDAYHLLHAARAELLRRIGEGALAAESYRRALGLVGNESERRFLERRLHEVETNEPSPAK